MKNSGFIDIVLGIAKDNIWAIFLWRSNTILCWNKKFKSNFFCYDKSQNGKRYPFEDVKNFAIYKCGKKNVIRVGKFNWNCFCKLIVRKLVLIKLVPLNCNFFFTFANGKRFLICKWISFAISTSVTIVFRFLKIKKRYPFARGRVWYCCVHQKSCTIWSPCSSTSWSCCSTSYVWNHVHNLFDKTKKITWISQIWPWFDHNLTMIWHWYDHDLTMIWRWFCCDLTVIWPSFHHNLIINWTWLEY